MATSIYILWRLQSYSHAGIRGILGVGSSQGAHLEVRPGLPKIRIGLITGL